MIILPLNGQQITENSDKQNINSRKRKRYPSNWARNRNKKLRQSGEEYTNCKGDTKSSKEKVTKGCLNGDSCKLNCNNKLNLEERCIIKCAFWQ